MQLKGTELSSLHCLKILLSILISCLWRNILICYFHNIEYTSVAMCRGICNRSIQSLCEPHWPKEPLPAHQILTTEGGLSFWLLAAHQQNQGVKTMQSLRKKDFFLLLREADAFLTVTLPLCDLRINQWGSLLGNWEDIVLISDRIKPTNPKPKQC